MERHPAIKGHNGPQSSSLKWMKKPRLVAIDMDGTLLGSDGQVSERNLRALREAEAAGIEVVIATGRRHSYALRVLRDLELTATNTVVSSNGTVIRTVGSELLHRHHLPASTARWLCAHVRDFRNSMVITFDLVGDDGEDRRGALVVEELDYLHASIGRWMEVNAPYIAHVKPLENALQGEAPIQMMLCGPVQRMREAEALLREHPGVQNGDLERDPAAEVTLHRTEYPDRDLCILDILPANVSKASALRHLCELQGFGMEDVMAIGDNWNDLPMLEAVGQPVLMSNAPPDLLEHAQRYGWAIAPSNDHDGVAETLAAVLELSQNEQLATM